MSAVAMVLLKEKYSDEYGEGHEYDRSRRTE